MVSDSSASDDDRVWSVRKVFRSRGALIGISGQTDETALFMAWWRGGMKAARPRFSHSDALILRPGELVHYSGATNVFEKVAAGREAIGSGGKAAMCAYEALGWSDPRRAVKIVCRHDAGSRAPVRVYRLKQGN